MKALPPANTEDFTVETGLSMAMEGINLAIGKMLTDSREQHRYAEVMRLATIGKALERQRARASKRVADFVPPGAPRDGDAAAFDDYRNLGGQGPRMGRYQGGGIAGCGYGRGEMADIEDLGDEPVDAPGDREPRDLNGDPNVGYGGGGAVFNNPILNGGAHLGAPYGVRQNGNDDGMGGLGGMVATVGGVFTGIADARKAENDSGQRLDRAKEIDALSRALDKTEDPERRARLQGLIDQATDKLEESNSAPAGGDDPEPEVEPEMQPPPDRPQWRGEAPAFVMAPPPEQRIVCTQVGCGNVHGDHWRNAAGDPLDCDVCNSPMMEGGRPG